MQVFHIRYRNSQGALMRILNAVSRRGLDLSSVHAEYAGQDHLATILLEVSQKQVGQLYREWNAIVDVIHVHSSAALHESMWSPLPPLSAGAGEQSTHAASA
jgi:acetolactate synthase small subunit